MRIQIKIPKIFLPSILLFIAFVTLSQLDKKDKFIAMAYQILFSLFVLSVMFSLLIFLLDTNHSTHDDNGDNKNCRSD